MNFKNSPNGGQWRIHLSDICDVIGGLMSGAYF